MMFIGSLKLDALAGKTFVRFLRLRLQFSVGLGRFIVPVFVVLGALECGAV